MKTLALIILINILCFITGLAKPDSINFPRVGYDCPDFTLEEVEYFYKTKASLKDFRGKWLILDFWGEYCASCISAFPKMNKIQEIFSKDLQIVFIGVPYKDEKTIRSLYKKHQSKLNLNIPIAFNRKLASQFKVTAYPHIVVIDPQGTVRYIVSSLTTENVKKIIRNEKLIINQLGEDKYTSYRKEIPFLIDGNGGKATDYLYRSILTTTSELTPPTYLFQNKDKLEILGFPLRNLYKYARTGIAFDYFLPIDTLLYGKFWPKVILEISDTSLFDSNFETKKNLFSYAVYQNEKHNSPVSNPQINFRNALKKDLEIIFPYELFIEKRKMPFNRLSFTQEAINNLTSKSDTAHFEWIDGIRQGFTAKKMSIFELINGVVSTSGYDMYIPLLYEGEDFYIDITINSIYFDDLLIELKSLGINILKDQKEFEVLVIRDNEAEIL